MKSDYLIINTYINNATKGIKDRQTEIEIKDELFSHLIEIYERNIALGMDDVDAQTDAVSHMGESEAIAESFKKLYPISILKYFEKIAWVTACPLLYTFSNNDSFIPLLLLIIMLYGLCYLRKIDKLFNISLAFNVINIVIQVIFTFLMTVLLIDQNILKISVLLYYTLNMVTYILILFCLYKYKKKLNAPKYHFILAAISIVLVIATNIIMFFATVNDITELRFLVLATSILPCAVVYTTIKDLSTLSFNIKTTKHLLRNYLICLLAFIGMMIGFNYAGYLNDSSTTEYIIDDTNVSVTEIKENMISLGLPREIADDLPESEILKYKNATELEIEQCDDYNEIISNEEGYEDEALYTVYYFTINKNVEYIEMRVLFDIDRFEEYDSKLYTKIAFDSFDYDTFEPSTSDLFCKMLCNIDGVTRELPPIFNEVMQDDSFKDIVHIYGFVRNSENYRAYIAHNIKKYAEDERIIIRHDYNQFSMQKLNEVHEKYWSSLYHSFYGGIDNPLYREKMNEGTYD